MKKSLLAVAALGMFAGVAHAQSSVSLYGIIDEGVDYISNAGGKQVTNVQSGLMQGSRWGMTGSEDLGNGMKAVFRLENGFDINTGNMAQANAGSTQGLEFGRQAYVGLSTTQGTVTFGRQTATAFDFVGPLAASNQWGGVVDAHPGDVDNLNNSFRVNNAIKYVSPEIAGVTFGAEYSMGGVAGDASRNSLFSLGAAYANGPVKLAAGYTNARNPNVGYFGDNGASVKADENHNLIKSPVMTGFDSAHTYETFNLGGAYTFGPATVGLVYSNTKFDALGDKSSGLVYGYQGKAVFNNTEVNVKYQLQPQLLLGASFNYMDASSVGYTDGSTGGAKYYTYTLGADYSLTKRTDVYALGLYEKASGHDSTGGAAVASINGVTPSASDAQAMVRVGLRHKF